MFYDPPDHVLNYAQKHALPFPVMHDGFGEIAKSFEDVRLTPTSFIMDKQGRIIQRVVGELDFDSLHRLLTEQLGEKQLMLWVKAWHIIFMVTWFAGLFYLPRLFVYHAMCDIAKAEDATSIARFKIMEHKLFYGIMTPGAIFTLIFGLWLWLGYGIQGGWLHAKLVLVALLVAYHIYCGKAECWISSMDRNRHSHVYYRWLNEVR